MNTVTTVQENAEDIYEGAKQINEERAEAKVAAEFAAEAEEEETEETTEDSEAETTEAEETAEEKIVIAIKVKRKICTDYSTT